MHIRVYLQLPEGYEEVGECAKLLWCLYGTRDVWGRWADTYSEALVNNMGFVRGQSSPCVPYHPGNDLDLVVHGDDFAFSGEHPDLKWSRKEFASIVEIKLMGALGRIAHVHTYARTHTCTRT